MDLIQAFLDLVDDVPDGVTVERYSEKAMKLRSTAMLMAVMLLTESDIPISPELTMGEIRKLSLDKSA
jgi:hypothetical protein